MVTAMVAWIKSLKTQAIGDVFGESASQAGALAPLANVPANPVATDAAALPDALQAVGNSSD